MLLILPRPKFALKWQLNIENCPENWKVIVTNALCWALSQNLKWRDKFLQLDVFFVSKKFWNEKFWNEKIENKIKNNKVRVLEDNIVVQNLEKENRIFTLWVCTANILENILKTTTEQDNLKNIKPDPIKFQTKVLMQTEQKPYYQHKQTTEETMKKLINMFVKIGIELLNLTEREKPRAIRKSLAKFGIC